MKRWHWAGVLHVHHTAVTKPKIYLGDAVYAEQSKYNELVLTTEDGIRVTNRIVLEPEVLVKLMQYMMVRSDG